MTKRILYPIVFALLLLLGGWGSKASGQSSGATYAVRYTLPKGVSDLRCVTHFPPEGKVVVTSGRKLPAGAQLTFTATVEDGYEIDHWMVNGELAQHEPEGYGGARMMKMEMPEEDIDVVIVMKSSATRLRSSEECIVTLESSAGGHLSALYVDFDPFEQEEQEVNVESGDAVPKNITLEVNAIPDMGAKIGKWYQDGVAIDGSEGSTRRNFTIRKDTKIKVDFEASAKPFEGYTVTLPEESPEGTITAYYEDGNYNHVSLQAGDNKVPKWMFVFLTATPKAGYEFSYWTFNGQRNDDLFMKLSDNSCRFEPDADVTVGAVFKRTAPAGHKITLTAGEGGTLQCSLSNGTEVQSGSTVDDGVALRFTAKPKSGYKTDQWTINGEPFAKGKGKNTIIQKADKPLNVEVSFLKDIELYTVEYVAEAGGTIKSATYYDRTTYNYVDFQSGKELPKDTDVDIEVEPKAGYVVDLWYLNDQPIDASKGKTSQTITISENSKIRITFATKPKQTVTYTASTGGTIQGTLLGTAFDSGSKLDEGSYIIFTATPDDGYEVDQWRIDDEVITRYAGKKEITERLGNKPLKVEVSFKKLPVTFPVFFTAGEGGTIVATVAEGSAQKGISSGDAIVQYSQVTFTAKPKSGYHVDQWTVNDQPQKYFAGKPELTRTVRDALKVHVTFKEDKPAKLCTINYTKENEWGTLVAYYDTQASGRINVKPGDKVEEGYMITFLATPKEGYTIDHWTYNGTKTPHVKPEMLTVTARENMTVAVVCNKAKLCTVTFDAVSEGGKMTASYLKDEGFNGYKDVYIKSGEQVPAGTEVTFVVTLTEGYTLEHWLVNNTKKACDKYNPLRLRELVINEDTEVKAVYKAPQKPQHAVTFTAGEGGAIAATVGPDAKAIQSNDQVEQGAVITFTATPQDGYELDQWMVNDNPAVAGADTKIEGNKLIVTLGDQDLKVKATFKKVIVTYEVTYSAGEGGDIVGATFNGREVIPSGSKVNENIYMRFTAKPNTEQGYKVDRWFINGEVQSQLTGRPYITWQIKAKTDVKVTFKKEQMYEVNYKPDNEWGTIEAYYYDRGRKVAVEPKAMIKEGTFVEFQATVKDGYVLDAWTNNGEEIPVADIETLKASITLRANAVIDVKYHKLVVKHTVTFTAGEGGTVAATVGAEAKAIQSKDQVEQGAVITFTATPKEGYELDQWMVNDKPAVAGADTKIEGNKLIVTLGDQDLLVKVTFKKLIVKHAVTFTAGEGGTIAATVGAEAKAIQSKDQVEQGAVITFTATPKEGYELDQWMVNGKPAVAGADTKIEGNKLIVTLGDQDLKVEATFKKLIVKHAVTFTAGEGGAIAATVGADAKAIQSKDQVEQGAVITFTATPQEGYELDQWMVNDKPAVAGTDTKIEGNKLIVTLGDQDLKVQATFKKVIVKHAVTFTAGEGGAIAATVGPDAKAIQSEDQVEQGAVITFTATPQEGYELDQWMVNGKPAVAGADTKIEGNKLIVTLGDQDLKVEATFRKGNAISQISEAELAVYPNPFAERIVITIPAERIGQTAYLTSMQGEVVMQMTLEQTETVLYTDALSQGTYLLRVGSHSQLLIKE